MSQSSEAGWRNERGYVWSLVGSAVGFANLLGFGSQCYRYGGGAFLIPFVVAMFVLGIPMLMLEGVIGQRLQAPLVPAYEKAGGRWAKFFGWMAVIAVTTIGAFYMVLTGWSLAYTYYAAAGVIPEDTASFFANTVLGATGSLGQVGAISWPVLIATAAVVGFSWYVLSRNIRDGIERWCSIFLPLLAILVALFTAVVCVLPGAWIGILKYLQPDLSKIADFNVWRDVFGQLFFSLSLGLGIVVGYSRHTHQKTCIRRAMMQVAIADFAISFLAGLVTFGCIGYMAQQQGVPFDAIVANASTFDIGYVIFPKILQTFGPVLSRVIGVLFFFSVFIAGITGVFSIIESAVGNVEHEFAWGRRRAVATMVLVMGMMTIPFCLGNGTALIDALAPAVMGDNMLIGAIAQIAVFLMISPLIRYDQAWYSGDERHPAYLALRYVGIPILSVILVASIADTLSTPMSVNDVIRWGWVVLAVFASVVLAARGRCVEQRLGELVV